MRNWIIRAAAVVVVAAPAFSTASFAQQTAADADRLGQLERRFEEMEARHARELADRDRQIEQLRGGVPTAPAAGATATDDIDRAERDALAAVEADAAMRSEPRRAASALPDIAVVADFLASGSSARDNDALNRVDVREVELDLRAAVDPRADGVAVITLHRHADNPIFHEDEEGGEEEHHGVETEVSAEEAYIFLHDFGVPNLTAKLGRFNLRFGRQNLLHLHDLPTVEPAFVNQAFLGPESLADAGVSLSYVVPPDAVGGQYVELIAEVISGEGSDESPTLGGGNEVDSPAFNTHVLWNTDLGDTRNLEVGASWLVGEGSEDNQQDVNLFGVDLTLVRTDPSGGFGNRLLQAEAIYGVVDAADDAGTNHAFGAYVLGQQQLDRDWYAGLRLDWTENPVDDAEEAYGVSPYVSWYWSEFLRFRAEYLYKNGDVDEEHTLYLQATWIYGSHPPHPYWAMR